MQRLGLSRNIESQLVINALNKALESRWSESIQGIVIILIMVGKHFIVLP
jgi:hypothetical protein